MNMAAVLAILGGMGYGQGKGFLGGPLLDRIEHDSSPDARKTLQVVFILLEKVSSDRLADQYRQNTSGPYGLDGCRRC